MDPNEILRMLREQIVEYDHLQPKADWNDEIWECADRMAETMRALDEWLTGGGYLPDDWEGKNTVRHVFSEKG